MINNLTGKKMESTYLPCKDGKGFIFDIKRPAELANTENYEGGNASFNGLETRTGLGNRVLRRVNFIKPPIKPRTVSEGKLQMSAAPKTLEQLIKEGIKIKYEEPDPWELIYKALQHRLHKMLQKQIKERLDNITKDSC